MDDDLRDKIMSAAEVPGISAPTPRLSNQGATIASGLFAGWAKREGILDRITEQECAELAAAFLAGFAWGAAANGLYHP